MRRNSRKNITEEGLAKSAVDLDIIPGKVDPSIGSIRYIRIDGFLSEKSIWDSRKWIPLCRFKDCKNESPVHLCQEHYRNNNFIVGEKRIRLGKKFKWCGKEWKQLCTVEFCENSSIRSEKSGKCKLHQDTNETVASISHNRIEENIRNELLIRKQMNN